MFSRLRKKRARYSQKNLKRVMGKSRKKELKKDKAFSILINNNRFLSKCSRIKGKETWSKEEVGEMGKRKY